MIMNYLFVFAIFTTINGAVLNAEHSHVEMLKAAETECAKEKNITLEDLANAEKGIYPAPPNDKLNCFTECLFLKAGFLKDNILQVDIMKQYGKEKGGETYEKIVETCATKKGTDNCDTTLQVYKCFNEEVAKLVPAAPEISPAFTLGGPMGVALGSASKAALGAAPGAAPGATLGDVFKNEPVAALAASGASGAALGAAAGAAQEAAQEAASGAAQEAAQEAALGAAQEAASGAAQAAAGQEAGIASVSTPAPAPVY